MINKHTKQNKERERKIYSFFFLIWVFTLKLISEKKRKISFLSACLAGINNLPNERRRQMFSPRLSFYFFLLLLLSLFFFIFFIFFTFSSLLFPFIQLGAIRFDENDKEKRSVNVDPISFSSYVRRLRRPERCQTASGRVCS